MHLAGFRGAGAKRHAAVAGGADGKARQQDRAGHGSWWCDFWTARFQQALDLGEHRRIDDRRHVGEDLLGRGLAAAGAGLGFIGPNPTAIDRMGQQGVDLADARG